MNTAIEKLKTMAKIERELRLLGEVAIKHYGDECGRTTDAISMAQDLIKATEQVEKYVDLVFMNEEEYLLFPVYTYGYMSVFGDRKGVEVRGFLIDKLEEELFHAILLSVDSGNLERFVYVCMNVGEVLKEEYLERVESLNKQKELVSKRFEQLNK
ncbi:hypothetical protein CN507_10655 [Bacillus cereus]|uniref:hypothetical protein n=1 Tax=Bacillus TaxID=1386 RepID=UPI000BF3752E|nr:hypothetical protein [Bacillus mycoides]PES68239.1 hypothetical protein CN507_10655 [Bacillus cereus]QWG60326.1 hypothetical protein EXW60_04150 [Bacillus mycoides]QWG91411.1 hypothetical protein EXW40_20570 [Bacillus mycoides]QWJ05290.1 hypothetical protein J5V76_20380 [Bacillus mycoides]